MHLRILVAQGNVTIVTVTIRHAWEKYLSVQGKGTIFTFIFYSPLENITNLNIRMPPSTHSLRTSLNSCSKITLQRKDKGFL